MRASPSRPTTISAVRDSAGTAFVRPSTLRVSRSAFALALPRATGRPHLVSGEEVIAASLSLPNPDAGGMHRAALRDHLAAALPAHATVRGPPAVRPAPRSHQGGLLYAATWSVPCATLLARTLEVDVKACALSAGRLDVRGGGRDGFEDAAAVFHRLRAHPPRVRVHGPRRSSVRDRHRPATGRRAHRRAMHLRSLMPAALGHRRRGPIRGTRRAGQGKTRW